jgi:hypothetical protein
MGHLLALPFRRLLKVKSRLFSVFPWYYMTRALGVALVVAGLLDNSPERSTLILAGTGLLGIDKVARSEQPKAGQKNDTDR